MEHSSPGKGRPSRWWKLGHPLLICGLGWLTALPLVGGGVLLSVIMLASAPSGRFPGGPPMAPIAVGVGAGLIGVVLEKKRLRRRVEEEAKLLAFPPWDWSLGQRAKWVAPQMGLVLLPILLLVGVVAAMEVAARGLTGWGLRMFGPAFVIGLGATMLPRVFAYPERLAIYKRARQLATGSDEPTGPYRDRAVEERVPWPEIFGALSCVAVLGVGGWLQWWLPWAAQAEPREYVTANEPGGRATLLTYGGDAWSPAFSPDGNQIAYVREDMPFNHLEVMGVDGSKKRRLGGERGPSPELFSPFQWSPNGRRILAVGEQGRRAGDWLDMPEPSGRKEAWVVEVGTGACRRVTRSGDVVAATWTNTGRVILLRGHPEEATLWVAGEPGRPPRQISKLRVRGRLSPACLWREGQEVVVLGSDASPGVWSVNLVSGEATKCSEERAFLAAPIDTARVVIGVSRRVGNSRERTFSVGVLDTGSGEVRWLVEDLHGLSCASVVPGRGVLLVSVYETPADLGQRAGDLWELSLETGRMRRLIRGKYVWQVTTNGSGRSVVYVARGKIQRRGFSFMMGMGIWRLELKGRAGPPDRLAGKVLPYEQSPRE